jgi:hypothetical protein
MPSRCKMKVCFGSIYVASAVLASKVGSSDVRRNVRRCMCFSLWWHEVSWVLMQSYGLQNSEAVGQYYVHPCSEKRFPGFGPSFGRQWLGVA